MTLLADRDFTHIEDDAAEIHEHIVADGDIVSHFADEVRLDEYVFSDAAKELPLDLLADFGVVFRRFVYARNRRFATSLLASNSGARSFCGSPASIFSHSVMFIPRTDILDRLVLNGEVFKNPYAAFALRRLRLQSDLDGIAHGQMKIARHVKMFAVEGVMEGERISHAHRLQPYGVSSILQPLASSDSPFVTTLTTACVSKSVFSKQCFANKSYLS